MNLHRMLMAAAFVMAALPAALAQAAPTWSLDAPVEEGRVIRGLTTPGNTVTVDGTVLPVSSEGAFVFGLHRDHETPVVIEVTTTDGETASRTYEVAQREYQIQRIDGLPDKMVTPRSDEDIARIKRDLKIKAAARPVDTPATWFTEDFAWPATGPISGVYGSQRILNGEPRRPHFGVDVAGPTGTPVTAPAGGVITLAEPDMYFEGGLIFLDHGHGLISVLMHLDSVDVKAGQKVTKGEQIGTIGSTGRSTGPHLDWRMYWREARVDPTGLVGPMPE